MTKEKIKGILWDMDGVIVDTGELHYQTWADVLSRYGVSYSRDQFRRYFGMNNVSIMKILMGDHVSPELMKSIPDEKEELFRKRVDPSLKPYPGVIDCIDLFHRLGYRQAVASSAPWENIVVIIRNLGLDKSFDTLVSGLEMPGKPAPDVFLKAAGEIGIAPGACVVIEDSLAGVAAAKAAGMRCIAVTNTHSAEALSGADRIVKSLEEVAASQKWMDDEVDKG
jgi:HAD superfamily hydrolase (TIGR01509 family)